MGRTDRLREFWRDKWLFAAALAFLWKARIAISFFGFRQSRERCVRTAGLPPAPRALLGRVNRSIARAAGLVAAPTCLVQASAGQQLLALKGYGSEIRVGVRKAAAAGFEAHAWLVSGEAMVLGGTAEAISGYRTLIGPAE